MSLPPKHRSVAPPSRPIALLIALMLALGGLVVSTVTGVLGVLAGALVGAVTTPSAAVPVVIGMLLVATETGFVALGYAFRQSDDGADIVVDWVARNGPSVRDAALIVGATAGLVAINRLGFWLGAMIGIDPVTSVSAPDERSIVLLAVLIPAMLFVVGPAEEYLFRGVIQGYLEGSFSARGALGWSTVLFALVHLPNLVSDPAAGVVSVPLWLTIGLALGWLYQRTGALLVPVAVHGLYNVAVITLLFAELGIV